MNLDKRIDETMGALEHQYYRRDEEVEAVKQLIRDVLQYVNPGLLNEGLQEEGQKTDLRAVGWNDCLQLISENTHTVGL